MISPDEIKKRAQRQYENFLRTWLRGEAFQVLDFPVGAISKDYSVLKGEIQQLREKSKESLGYGYSLIWVEKQSHDLGHQTLPSRVVIENAGDFLALLNKQAEFHRFQADVSLIRQSIPRLEDWIGNRPTKIIEQHGLWPELLKVCTYFLQEAKPSLYLRELPIEVHSKFIEENASILRELLDELLPEEFIDPSTSRFELRYGLKLEEPVIRLRLLDTKFKSLFAFVLDDFAAPLSQIAKLPLQAQKVIIVENKITFLTLPQMPNTVAIWGMGFQVELLGAVDWLREAQIYYWGDLDAQGFQILSTLRSRFSKVISFLMDTNTFEKYQQFVVKGTPMPFAQLAHLSTDEFVLYEHLVTNNLRLEQERISHADLLKVLSELGSG